MAKGRLPIYVTPPEVRAMLRATTDARDHLLLWLLWVSGGRISEVLTARVGDVTDDGIRLRSLKKRSAAEKFVFLPTAVVAELRAAVEGRPDDAYIITRRQHTEPLSRKTAWEICTRAAARAGVFKLRSGVLRPAWPHCWRHGNAVHQVLSGVPITAVQDQLGHANLSSTEVYTALADPEKRRLIAGVRF